MVPEINPYPAQNGLLEISRRGEVSKDKNVLRKVKTNWNFQNSGGGRVQLKKNPPWEGNEYSRTSREWPPKMSSLGGCLMRWSLMRTMTRLGKNSATFAYGNCRDLLHVLKVYLIFIHMKSHFWSVNCHWEISVSCTTQIVIIFALLSDK